MLPILLVFACSNGFSWHASTDNDNYLYSLRYNNQEIFKTHLGFIVDNMDFEIPASNRDFIWARGISVTPEFYAPEDEDSLYMKIHVTSNYTGSRQFKFYTYGKLVLENDPNINVSGFGYNYPESPMRGVYINDRISAKKISMEPFTNNSQYVSPSVILKDIEKNIGSSFDSYIKGTYSIFDDLPSLSTVTLIGYRYDDQLLEFYDELIYCIKFSTENNIDESLTITSVEGAHEIVSSSYLTYNISISNAHKGDQVYIYSFLNYHSYEQSFIVEEEKEINTFSITKYVNGRGEFKMQFYCFSNSSSGTISNFFNVDMLIGYRPKVRLISDVPSEIYTNQYTQFQFEIDSEGESFLEIMIENIDSAYRTLNVYYLYSGPENQTLDFQPALYEDYQNLNDSYNLSFALTKDGIRSHPIRIELKIIYQESSTSPENPNEPARPKLQSNLNGHGIEIKSNFHISIDYVMNHPNIGENVSLHISSYDPYGGDSEPEYYENDNYTFPSVMSFISDGTDHTYKFEYDYVLPDYNSHIFNVVAYAEDSKGVRSNSIYTYYYTPHERLLYIKAPKFVELGSQVQVSCYTDFLPPGTVMTFSLKNPIGEVINSAKSTANNQSLTEEIIFTFQAPEVSDQYWYRIEAISQNREIMCIDSFSLTAAKLPQFYSVSLARTTYGLLDDIEFIINYTSGLQLIPEIQFDNRSYYEGSYITLTPTEEEWKIINFTISSKMIGIFDAIEVDSSYKTKYELSQYADNITYGKHNLSLKLQTYSYDEFGVFNIEFELIKKMKPYLNILYTDTLYSYLETVNLTYEAGVYLCQNPINIFYTINDSEPILLKTIENAIDKTQFTQEIRLPKIHYEENMILKILAKENDETIIEESQIYYYSNDIKYPSIEIPRNGFYGTNFTISSWISGARPGKQISFEVTTGYGSHTYTFTDSSYFVNSPQDKFYFDISIPIDSGYCSIYANIGENYKITLAEKYIEAAKRQYYGLTSSWKSSYYPGETITISVNQSDFECYIGVDDVLTYYRIPRYHYDVFTRLNVFTPGMHTITFAIYKDYMFYNFTHEAMFFHYFAPSYSVDNFDHSNYYNFYETAKFNIQFQDGNIGKIVTIKAMINNNVTIYQHETTGKKVNYLYEYVFPKQNARNHISFFIENEFSSFQSQNYEVYVTRNPGLIIYAHQKTNTFRTGDQLGFNIFGYDFNPNAQVNLSIEIYNSSNNLIYQRMYLEYIEFNENYSSPNVSIEVTVPQSYSSNEIKIRMFDNQGNNEYQTWSYSKNDPPIIYNVSTPIGVFVKNGQIEFPFTAYDDDGIVIHYNRDDFYYEDILYQKSEDKPRGQIKQTKIIYDFSESPFTPGEHTIKYYFTDTNQKEPEQEKIVYNFTFTIHNITRPKIYPRNTRSYSYGYHEDIILDIECLDYNKGQYITIFCKYRGLDQDSIVVTSYVTSGESYRTTYSIPAYIIPEDVDTFYLWAVNEFNLSSSVKRVGFHRYLDERVDIVSTKKEWYNQGETTEISFIVRGYKPNTTLTARVSLNDVALEELSIMINSNYQSDIYNVSITIPMKKGNHYVIVELLSTNIYGDLSILVSTPPQIIYWNQTFERYFIDGVINFDALISDDDNRYIYIQVYLDDSYYTQYTYYFDKNLIVTQQIQIPQWLSMGYHDITIKLKDSYNLYSEPMTRRFYYDNRNAPVLHITPSTSSTNFHYYETVVFNVSVRDLDSEDDVYVYLKINNDPPIELINTHSNAEWHSIMYTYKIPNITGRAILEFSTKDSSGAEGLKVKYNYDITNYPQVILLSSIADTYLPGDIITIKGFITDFTPGKYAQVLYKVYDGTIENIEYTGTNQLLMNENYSSDIFEFNIILPSITVSSSLTLWAVNEDRKSSYTSYYYFSINTPPKLESWPSLKSQISIGESIPITFTATDDSYFRIYGRFDNQNSDYYDVYSEYIKLESAHQEKTIYFNVPSKFTFADHTLSIWIRDEFGSKSEVLTHPFKYVSSHAPEFTNVSDDEYYISSKKYLFSDNITLTGKVRDIDPQNTFNVLYSFDNGEYHIIDTQTSDGNFHDFKYDIPVPKIDGDHILKLRAIDQSSAISNIVERKYSVKRARYIKFLNNFEEAYEKNTQINVSIQLFDFTPQKNISLIYTFNNEIHDLGVVHVDDNFISDVANFTLQLPDKLDELYLVITAKEDSVSFIREKYIVINSAPEFHLWNEINPIYYKPAYILVEAGFIDNRGVKIYYQINNEEPVAFTDKFIATNGRLVNDTYQIAINREKDFTFDLKLYAQDASGWKSNIITKSVSYNTSFSTPDLRLDNIKYICSLSEPFECTAKVTDRHAGNNIRILYRINEVGEFREIDSFVSQGVEISRKLIIPIPHVEGIYMMYIRAVNNDGIESQLFSIQYKVSRSYHIYFTNSPQVYYPKGSQINISGCASDFDSGTAVEVLYQLDSNPMQNLGQVVSQENYLSNQFSILLNNNDDTKTHTINIYLKIGTKYYFNYYWRFIINTPPSLNITRSERDVYYTNDHFDLEIYLKDNTKCKLYYAYNDASPYSYFINYDSYGKIMHYKRQITVPNLKRGSNTLNIYAIDEFETRSETISIPFTYDDTKFAPQIVYSFDRSKQYFAYHETIEISGKVLGIYGSSIYFYYKFNETEYERLDPMTATNDWQNFNFHIKVPRQDNVFVLTFEARNEFEGTSEFLTHIFKVEKKPGIFLDPSMPKSFKRGDNVTVKGYIGDYEKGQEFSIYYSLTQQSSIRRLHDESKTFVTTLITNENMRTDPFTFNLTIPNIETKQKLDIWAENSGNRVAEINNTANILNIEPELLILNTLNHTYYNKGFIDLNIRLKDDNTAAVFYFIDDLPTVQLTNWTQCNGKYVYMYHKQIEISSNVTEFNKKHTLMIYAEDTEGGQSNPIKYEFSLLDKHPPVKEILNETRQINIFGNDIITIWGRVKDDDQGDFVRVVFSINNGPEAVIFNGISNGDWQYFSHNFTVPTGSGIMLYSFQAIDHNEARSRYTEYTVTTTKTTQYTIPRTYYIPTSSGYGGGGGNIGGGNIGVGSDLLLKDIIKKEVTTTSTKVYRYYIRYIEKVGTTFKVEYRTMENDMTLDQFIKKYAPEAVGGNIEILVEDNETNSNQTIIQPVVLYPPPEFQIMEPLLDMYYGNAYINLDLLITARVNGQVKYRIDDGDVKNSTDMMLINGKYRSRSQVEILKDSIEYKKHTIEFWVVDEIGRESNHSTHEFLYYSFDTPTLDIHEDETEDDVYNEGENVTIKGTINDNDKDKNLTVLVSIDENPFIEVHTCPAEDHPSCEKFEYSFPASGNNGTHKVTVQVKDDKNASSKNYEKPFIFINNTENNPTDPGSGGSGSGSGGSGSGSGDGSHTNVPPARTPLTPIPTRLPYDFTGKTSVIMIPTYSLIKTNNSNGEEVFVYVEVTTEYNISIAETSEKVEIGFFDTVFGKYVLWPLLVFVVLVIVGVVILVILLKRQEDKEDEEVSVDNLAFEETVQIGTTTDGIITNDNPLYTTTGGEDDPFHEDFEEQDNNRQDPIENDNEEIVDSESGSDQSNDAMI